MESWSRSFYTLSIKRQKSKLTTIQEKCFHLNWRKFKFAFGLEVWFFKEIVLKKVRKLWMCSNATNKIELTYYWNVYTFECADHKLRQVEAAPS